MSDDKIMIQKGDTYMQRGLLMGNINCPKCGKLIVDPKVVKLDNNGKPIIFCDCGCYFIFELK